MRVYRFRPQGRGRWLPRDPLGTWISSLSKRQALAALFAAATVEWLLLCLPFDLWRIWLEMAVLAYGPPAIVLLYLEARKGWR